MFTVAGSYALRLTATDSLLSASDDIAITVNPPAQNLPPDPVTVAPPLNRTVVTTTFKATEFLYTGSNPIQTGVASGTIVPFQAAVLQGKVTRQDGLPLPGVKIAILNHPELGSTLSRANGAFDIVVNGGGTLVISYEKDGFIPIQRQAQVPWQQHVVLPIAAMIPYDSQVTSIDLSQNVPMQVAQSSLITDTDGTRRTTLLFPGANAATMVLPNGSTQPLSQLHVRATEYTVGAQGLRAMPAELPPNSAYTYCVELSVDEAIAAGARRLNFSKPVIQYVENFLGIFIGTPVPEGYYDRTKGVWVASENGLVVRIVSIVDGQAQLDVDGSGMPATPQALDALGITGAERQQLALLYQPGQSLWRMTIPHFSPWDSNFGFFPPPDAQPPTVGDPTGDNKKVKCVPCPGSVIQVQNQTLGQAVDIVGTSLSLHYASDRVPGRTAANTLDIPISGATVPNGLKQIILETVIGGTSTWSKYGDVYDPSPLDGAVITQDFFPPTPNQSASIAWNGRGSYGRTLQGEQPMNVRIGYLYDGAYQEVPRFGYVGNSIRINTPDNLPGGRSGMQVALWKDWTGGITFNERAIGSWDAGGLGLGGWSLNVHHVYDPVRRTLYFGDGRERSANIDRIMKTVAGTGPSSGAGAFSGDGGAATLARLRRPDGIAVAPDGSLYISDSNNLRIRRVGLDGVITTVAGGNLAACSVPTAPCGDGGPATLARLGFPEEIKFGPDGSLYIADASFRRIRRVATDGIITTVAGTGTTGFSGDGGPAIQANLSSVYGLAVAPDGTLYLSDRGNHRIRRVGTDGIISTIAGTGIAGYSGDGGPAANAQLHFPEGLALGPDGSLYIADSLNNRVRKIDLGGTITTVAGNGNGWLVDVSGMNVPACSVGQCGDGGPAVQARIGFPSGVAVGPGGSLYISEELLVRRVSANGIISTIAGSNNFGSSGGEVGPATQLNLWNPTGVAVGPDGTLYIADVVNHRIRKVEQLLPGFAQTAQFEILIPDESGREVYVFDASGQHLRTVDALTQGIVYQFTYNSSGMLTALTDGNGNVTTIDRSGNTPTAIISPYGQRTTLSLDPNGYLASVTNPASEATTFTYGSTGLMNTLTDPKGGLHQFQYSAAGRLIHDADPAGGFTALARNGINPTDFDVTRSTTLGHASNFKVETLPTGEERRTNTSPEGTQVIETKSPNGGELTTLPDGTVDNLLEAADPRWGMMAALPKSQTMTTPGGLVSTITNTRAASLSDPSNPFSLQTQTDTININGRTYTSVFDGATRKVFVYRLSRRMKSGICREVVDKFRDFGYRRLDECA
ncbi:MAG: hypothetical protein L0387_16165, partial [Acidobacteria bacterium]|nr:hypothetical protein [Acidobacteriota bacterium]